MSQKTCNWKLWKGTSKASADEWGWHDAASGTCNAALVRSKWGTLRYQEGRNDYLRNGRDSFLIELAKYGLGKRDLPGNMNWFS